jgi:hypothetical protein
MEKGREFDAQYNAGELSVDALPAVLSALPKMTSEDQCQVRWDYLDRYREMAGATDLRSFNLARREALALLQENEVELQQVERCGPRKRRVFIED